MVKRRECAEEKLSPTVQDGCWGGLRRVGVVKDCLLAVVRTRDQRLFASVHFLMMLSNLYCIPMGLYSSYLGWYDVVV